MNLAEETERLFFNTNWDQVKTILAANFLRMPKEEQIDLLKGIRELRPELFKSKTIWIPYAQPTYAMFNVMASRNCLCKFDDGTVIPYNENHPFAEMTYFEYKPEEEK